MFASMALSSIAGFAERMVYRLAGLPVAVKALLDSASDIANDPLQAAFAAQYWNPDGAGEWSELLGALALWPVAVLVASAWFTWLNGAVIRSRHGKSVAIQLKEQFQLYFSHGILAPWYYIFSLHEDGTRRAPTFIQRFETKPCYFRLLKQRKGTPLNDKHDFALFCSEHGIRCVETLMQLDGKHPGIPLPDGSLFVKPTAGRGGRGAERWDRIEPSTFRSPSGEQLSGSRLLDVLIDRSRRKPLIVQPRLRPHTALLPLTDGALPTVRILTCLDADGQPEIIAATMRTAVGENRTVDNLHAGGIAALVDLDTGTLSRASNLGSDAHLGWLSSHPDNGAAIEGLVVPCWEELKSGYRRTRGRPDLH
jgi:hypothetical protein